LAIYFAAIHAIERTCLLGMRISRFAFSGGPNGGLPDILEFLQRYPPFADLDARCTELLGGRRGRRISPAGQIIFSRVKIRRVSTRNSHRLRRGGQRRTGAGPLGDGRDVRARVNVVRSSTGFEARAAEDTLTYRFSGGDRFSDTGGPWSVALRHATHPRRSPPPAFGSIARSNPGLSSPTRFATPFAAPRPSAHHRRRFVRRPTDDREWCECPHRGPG